MEFTFETVYDQKAMTAMAKALRKTVRKKRSRRSSIFGSIVIILGLFLALSASEVNMKLVVTIAAVLAVLIALIWQDSINGYVALKRTMPGLEKSIVCFRETGYHSSTAVGESDFPYTNILAVAESGDYFVFVFSFNHAQVYDKRSLSGGTADEFAAFLQEKTGKPVQKI